MLLISVYSKVIQLYIYIYICIHYFKMLFSIMIYHRIFFNWKIIALQCCVSFCCTAMRISHKYNISLLSRASPLTPHPTPLGHHRAQNWAPCYTDASDCVSDLPMLLYECQCCSQFVQPSPSRIGLFSTSVSLFQPCFLSLPSNPGSKYRLTFMMECMCIGAVHGSRHHTSSTLLWTSVLSQNSPKHDDIILYLKRQINWGAQKLFHLCQFRN